MLLVVGGCGCANVSLVLVAATEAAAVGVGAPPLVVASVGCAMLPDVPLVSERVDVG